MFAKHWLVADMDGTLTPTPSKAGGRYLPLTESPCLGPLQSLLSKGMNMCVVSTAGRRMWAQVFDCLKPTLALPRAGRLAICGFSGAALFVSSHCTATNTVRLVEDVRFRTENQTAISKEALPSLESQLRDRFLEVLRHATSDANYIPTLSLKYHEPFTALVKSVQDAARSTSFEEAAQLYLSIEQLKKHGLYLSATNDAIVDRQVVVVDGNETSEEITVQYTVLGVPMKYYDTIFPAPLREELDGLGFVCKAQPNSVVVCRKGVDKATCVRWLRDQYDAAENGSFALDRALAFGDIPVSIDKPLTLFPPMRFVSVSKDPSTDPVGECLPFLSVGGEEVGTAAFLTSLEEHMTAALEKGVPLFSDDVLEAARLDAVKRLHGAEGKL